MAPRTLLSLAFLTTATTALTVPSNVPAFALTYAPIVHLYSSENYQPSDIGAQIANTTPRRNLTAVMPSASPLTLDNLASALQSDGSPDERNIYLTSNASPTDNPAYLYGVAPDANGTTQGAVSCAVIVNAHADASGITDVFYMYFYAFNYGGSYGLGDFQAVVGDHVGDWEHTMVRFVNGTPSAVWFSQHSNGEAFTYAAVEKWTDGKRPVAYSANGTHANYATPGTHDHTIPNLNLPFGFVEDHTDAGAIWDPITSAYFYRYNASALSTVLSDPSQLSSNGTFTPYDAASSPVDWLSFTGKWGDDQYAASDPRQSYGFGIKALAKWVGGPTGPEDKQLQRTKVCPDNGQECILRPSLGP